MFHSMTKHIQSMYNFIQSSMMDGDLMGEKIQGSENLADMMTKIVITKKLKLWTMWIGLLS